MDYTEHLKPFGFEEKESIIYTHALSLGIFSTAEIATKTGIKRPTCYVILESLTKKGLISVVHQSTKLLYKAESPKMILNQAEKNVDLAKKLLPSLMGLHNQSSGVPVITFYSGQKGVQHIFEDSLKGGVKEYYCIGSAKHLVDIAGSDFMNEYVKKRVKAGIKVIGLRMKDKEVPDKMYEPNTMLRETRYTPPGVDIPSSIFIYKDKVAVISTKDNFGFSVESKEFAKSMLALFKSLWEQSTEA